VGVHPANSAKPQLRLSALHVPLAERPSPKVGLSPRKLGGVPQLRLSALHVPLAERPSPKVGLSPRKLGGVPQLRLSALHVPLAERPSPKVGLSGFEPETFPLSEERSNQLS
jgi:hypothetical protein